MFLSSLVANQYGCYTLLSEIGQKRYLKTPNKYCFLDRVCFSFFRRYLASPSPSPFPRSVVVLYARSLPVRATVPSFPLLFLLPLSCKTFFSPSEKERRIPETTSGALSPSAHFCGREYSSHSPLGQSKREFPSCHSRWGNFFSCPGCLGFVFKDV